MKKNAFYAQSGGVTSVINATAAAVIQEAKKFPNQIKNIQQELEDIKNELKDTNLYLENYERYQEITSKMEVLNSDLNTKENRWYELIKMEEDLVSN